MEYELAGSRTRNEAGNGKKGALDRDPGVQEFGLIVRMPGWRKVLLQSNSAELGLVRGLRKWSWCREM